MTTPDTFRYWARRIGHTSWASPQEHGIGSGDKLKRLIEDSTLVPFFAEEELEDLIAESPSLLTDSEGAPAAVAVQMHVPKTGNADVVIVDQAGEITIVECKLVANQEIGYSVVGQGLAYGAALWEMPYKQFEGRFNDPGRKDASTGLTAPFQAPDWDKDEFRAKVESNLADGRFHLVLAVDEITSKPNRTVAYLARRGLSSQIRLVGFELRRDSDHAIEILRLEEGSEDRAPTKRRRHDIPRIIDGIETRSPKAADVAVELLDWAKENGLKRRPTAAEVVISGPAGGTLFRIVGRRERVKVSLSRVRDRADATGDRRAADLEERLARLDFDIGGKHAVAPLELLAGDAERRAEFEELMSLALDVHT